MAAYVIVEIEVTDPCTYEIYKQKAAASLKAHGGRFIVRGGAATSLEGGWQPKRIVVLEFGSVDEATRWWASEDYAEAKAMRQRSAHTRMIAVEGVPGDPAPPGSGRA